MENFLIVSVCINSIMLFSSIIACTLGNYLSKSIGKLGDGGLGIDLYLFGFGSLIFFQILLMSNFEFSVFSEIEQGVNALYSSSPLRYFLELFIMVIVFFFFLIWRNVADSKGYQLEFFFFNTLVILGIFSIMNCEDLIVLYLAIEVQSFASYLLASSKRNSYFATEAGLKYYLLGALASSFIMFGIGLIYGATGFTHIPSIASYDRYFVFSVDYLELIGVAFLLLGLIFKLGLFPMHMWVPEVYQGVSGIVMMFYAVIGKLGIFIILIRLTYGLLFYKYMFGLVPFILFVGIMSIFLGGLFAIRSDRIKNYLAYSAIGHGGYIFLGFISIFYFIDNAGIGITGLIMYLILYSLSTLLVISILVSTRNLKGRMLNHVYSLYKVALNNRLLGFILGISLLTFAGLPPLASFYGKFYLLLEFVYNKEILLSILVMVCGLLGSVYVLRLVVPLLFIDSSRKDEEFFVTMSKSSSLVISTLFTLLMMFFIFPGFLGNIITLLVELSYL